MPRQSGEHWRVQIGYLRSFGERKQAEPQLLFSERLAPLVRGEAFLQPREELLKERLERGERGIFL
jgi:hypothetical protein